MDVCFHPPRARAFLYRCRWARNSAVGTATVVALFNAGWRCLPCVSRSGCRWGVNAWLRRCFRFTRATPARRRTLLLAAAGLLPPRFPAPFPTAYAAPAPRRYSPRSRFAPL